MEAIYLPEQDYGRWDDFVDGSPQGSVFAKSWYLEALGVRFRLLAAIENGTIQGGIPLTTDRWNYRINPVLGKYLGVLYADFEGHAYTAESRRREVVRTLMAELKTLPTFEYDFHPGFTNAMPFTREGFRQTTRYTYRIDLAKADGRQALLDLMGPRLRNKVTKCMRESGYAVHETEDAGEILPLVVETFRRKGMGLPLPLETLEGLLRAARARQAVRFLISMNEKGETGAVLGLLQDKRAAYLVLNGVRSDFDGRGVNETLIHEGILWSQMMGLEHFDFEGSAIPSIESFYRQFGGELTPYHHFWKPSPKRWLRRMKQRIANSVKPL